MSVVIPSFNGRERLPSVLRALESQDDQTFETVVVLDGSTDGSASAIRARPWRLEHLRILEFENGGRAVARNRGAGAAEGDLILFLDDDMRPVPEVVRAHKAHHDEHPGTILVGEQIEDPEAMKTDLQRFKAEVRKRWSRSLPREKGPLDPTKPYLTAAHCSMPRVVFEALGGFDGRLTDAEDFDLAVRAFAAGIDLHFSPSLIAWHDDFITCRGYIERRRQYARAHAYLRDSKPDLHSAFHHLRPGRPGPWKRRVYDLLARKFWIWSIDDWNWLRLLPRPVRYRIYEGVVWGYGTVFPDRPIR